MKGALNIPGLLKLALLYVKREMLKLRHLINDLERERLFRKYGCLLYKSRLNSDILNQLYKKTDIVLEELKKRDIKGIKAFDLKKKRNQLYAEMGETAYLNKIHGPESDYLYFKISDIMYKRKMIIESINIINNRMENPGRYLILFIMIIVLILLFIFLRLK